MEAVKRDSVVNSGISYNSIFKQMKVKVVVVVELKRGIWIEVFLKCYVKWLMMTDVIYLLVIL